MRNYNKICLKLALIMALCTACVPNMQFSSRQDAENVVAKQPNFRRMVQYFSIGSMSNEISYDPFVRESYPESSAKGKQFVHEIIYMTKNLGYCLVLLDDDNPPNIIELINLP